MILKPLRFKADEIIFKQGDQSDRLYLIKKGTVSLTSSIDITNYRRIPTVSVLNVKVFLGVDLMGLNGIYSNH